MYLTINVDVKEAAYGFVDSSSKDKPHVRSVLNYAFVNNIFATTLCYPLSFLLFNRNLMRGLKASLFLCVFSMGNDLFIEFRRKKYLQMNFSKEELHRMNFDKRMDDLKNDLKEALDEKNLPADQR